MEHEPSDEDKKRLFDEFDKKRKEIAELRTVLNQVNEEKEKWFSEKEAVSREIVATIASLKDIKRARDEFTAKVRSIKVKKEAVVTDIKARITEITALRQQKFDVAKKHDLKGDPIRIKHEIDRIETRIETDVFSFETEQKLMKKLKELKSQYSQFSEFTVVAEKMRDISRAIDELKNQEKEHKRDIRRYAKDSQTEHEKMLDLSKKIDELKVKEKESYDRFLEQKNQFSIANTKLKELLGEAGELGDSVKEIKEQKRHDKEMKERLTLEEKKNLVTEKIKTGKKLTTEDLLVYQRGE
jgi:uncharacterized coiled-coil DUF342 family protein